MWRMINIRFFLCLFVMVSLTSCGEYSALVKSNDYDYKYEAAKSYFMDGHYSHASETFGDLLAIMKGSNYGEECLYMLALSNYKAKDYESATSFFKKYYQSYPRGRYVEMSRYYCGCSLYNQTRDVRLDQSSTMEAITEFQNFLDYYPETNLKPQTEQMILSLQDKLVEKEYLAAKLYYDLGPYLLNSLYGGNNYEACVITAQNTLKDYPYANPERREELSILILRAKNQLARQSIDEKRVQRYRDVIDEYYAFVNDYPESKFVKEAQEIHASAEAVVKKKKLNLNEEE